MNLILKILNLKILLQKSLKEYFDQLQKEISELPEVKYYDERY